MNLADRLRQVVWGSVPRRAPADAEPRGEEPSALPAVDHLAAESAAIAEPRRASSTWRGRTDGTRVADVLGGQWLERGDGAVLIVDRGYTADRCHGRMPIGRIVETIEEGADALQVLARAWPGRDGAAYRPSLCFFDLETTGLAGGAGTQAFLVGCAVIEDGGIRVRQFLLPGFEHERALLGAVAEWAAGQGTLVSFNGRTFDLPLIETRHLLHRLPFPMGELPHLDMLHPARRLWKTRPAVAGPPLDDESCRLAVLERHLAGYHRVGDVPGFEIPSRYFRFVRDGDARPLEAVLEHNRLDLLSLALVTARAITLITEGPSASTHAAEALGLGRLYERAGAADDAEACYAHAASQASRSGREPGICTEALRRLALCRRRAGRMHDAARAWEAVLAVRGCPAALRREAREALAIHHEHRSRDLEAARLFVLDVLAEGGAVRGRGDAEYRLRRIERKISARATAGLLDAAERAVE